ncbi:FISUMP domain-containing protein [Sphingobacterium faecale]|uniref:Fibrobacter succinogenes major paralogous domain-containing protein n=1 Tax=Sphingobacterium faecale TaxID=2803775 RepID=A0ABS1R909_9SPHI|nr:FISUMP domain-containing protein [Sphingobacterium faecale]MBL1411197.1 hypothetical protein [Sphingobacterium faecale]
MKTQLIHIILVTVWMAALSSCKKDTKSAVQQPDFISTSLSGSLSVDAGEEFELFVPDNEEGVKYSWSIPDMLDLRSGQGTNRIKVISNIDKGIVPVKSIGVTAERGTQKSYTRWLYQEISILALPPTLDGYRTKRYGAKTWMIDNLNEAGDDGSLGKTHPKYPDFGRYYTWHEAVTGIPNATASDHGYVWGSSGTDDAGKPYVLDGTYANASNIQIQGICPKGWHIPNANDWYDLLVAIKEDFNVPGNSLDQIKQIKEGYIIAWSRQEGLNKSIVAGDWGVIGPYLKGSRPQSEGGLWLGGTTYTQGNWGLLPTFVAQSTDIGFNILPNGYWVSATAAWGDVEGYSWHLAAVLREPNDNRPLRVTIGNTNANFSNNLLGMGHSVCIRCVANY